PDDLRRDDWGGLADRGVQAGSVDSSRDGSAGLGDRDAVLLDDPGGWVVDDRGARRQAAAAAGRPAVLQAEIGSDAADRDEAGRSGAALPGALAALWPCRRDQIAAQRAVQSGVGRPRGSGRVEAVPGPGPTEVLRRARGRRKPPRT